jgi:DNA modification methylase
MPEKLTGALIQTYTNMGQRLLDCFGGVFSTAKLAILNQRRCVCIEKSPATFKVGVQRIESMDLKGLGLVRVKRGRDVAGWNYQRR